MKNQIRCLRHKCLEKDLKKLRKKFHSVDEDIVYAERLLSAGKTLPGTDPYPGFGQHAIRKTRVVNTSKGKGKSSGYRLIYEELSIEAGQVINEIMLYDHNSVSNEDEVKSEIQSRLNNPDYPSQMK